MKRGDFYEDDESIGELMAAFEAGEPFVTEPPRGQTWFLDGEFRPQRQSTTGSPGTVWVAS